MIDVDALNRRLTLRLIAPFLVLIVLNSLDRVNIGFAAVRMNADLGLSAQAYGFGVGLFFAGYMLCQVPAMALLQRVGLRLWITAVVLGWGLVATAMAFVQSEHGFYALRLLLGVTEAGFAPGVVYTCTQWMPQRLRAGAIAKTMLAVPISVLMGAPLSGWLMDAVNPLGWPGWRWMLLIEGIPTVLLGLAAWGYFVNKLEDARWLSAAEKRWLREQIDAEQAPASTAAPALGWRALFGKPAFWAAALTWFGLLAGAYGLIYWLPLVIKEVSQRGNLSVSLLSALPWVGIAAGMVINARHSDRTGERHLHVALPSLLAAAGLALAAWAGASWLALAILVVGGYGLGAAQGTFWTLPPLFLPAAALPYGIALINMTGNLAGLVTPPAIGWIKQCTGAYDLPAYLIAAELMVAAGMVLLLRAQAARRPSST